MHGRRLSAALAAVLLAAVVMVAAPPSVDAAAGDIVDPTPFVWTFVDGPDPHYVGVLEYGEATFTLNNGDTLTTRAYRQQGAEFSIPGPTIHMTPGNKYVLRFRNLLPYSAPSPDHNTFKDPDVTNVHTHGLHLSGESPGDDVLRMFEGGFGGDYVYDIPADHMGGTYWYHAHHHGSTFLQVSSGAFGLIVIEDGADGLPANVAAMEERELLVAYLDPSVAGTGGDTLISGTLGASWTVNGTVAGTLTVPPDTWQHWRVLLADSDARTKDLVVGDGCEVMLLARDGVWRTTAPAAITDGTLELTGASRADLAVRCSTDTTIQVNRTTVANVVVAGTADPGPHPFAPDGSSTWSAVRPSYLRDLSGETVVHTEDISVGARSLNNLAFDATTPTLTLNADAVQEWTLSGAANHPFHLHVYHVQTFGCGGDYEDGEYYDTIASACTVRFDLSAATSSPFSGKTIMHCHVLDHEDRGAMGWVDVIGGTPAPTFPTGWGYSEYYPVPVDGTIEGTVTDTAAAPIHQLAVWLYVGTTVVDTTTTDATGHYAFTVAPDTAYKVRFVGNASYAGEYFDDAPNLATSTPITVGSGATVVADAVMASRAALASVSGTVTAAGTGAPLAGIRVRFIRDGVSWRTVVTGADGTFSSSGLDPTGSWTAWYFDPGGTYQIAYYDQRPTLWTADLVGLTGGADTDLSTALWLQSETAAISGTVTAAVGGGPLAGMDVRVFTNGRVAADATTSLDGSYAVADLLPGTYQVRVSDPGGTYGLRWWDDAGGLASATPIVLGAAASIGAIDVALPG